MIIRKAKESDIDQIEKIYDHIHDLEESGSVTIGWIRGIYPIRKTAEDSLNRGDLFVMEDENEVVATAIINQIQVPDYAKASWKHEAENDEIMVLHTLIVDPEHSSKGYGKAFVNYYEEYAKKHGCSELRMDTNAINANARAMYKKLGYDEADIVPCVFNGIPDVMLVCLEKNLGYEIIDLPKIAIIGKEGLCTKEKKVVQELWQQANSNFSDIADLGMKNADGSLVGFWGAMSDETRSFLPWTDDFSRGLYLAGIEVYEDTAVPDGWVKWVMPARKYLVTKVAPESYEETFRNVINSLIPGLGMKLAGAVCDFTEPATGQNKLFFPVE